jgi:hypothetical protein
LLRQSHSLLHSELRLQETKAAPQMLRQIKAKKCMNAL